MVRTGATGASESASRRVRGIDPPRPALAVAGAQTPAGTFEDFYATEYARVLKHALWLVRDLPSAEDLTQDAFIAAHRRWPEVAALDWPAGWVQRVVSNRAVSRYRRLVRDGRLVTAMSHRRAAPIEVAEDRSDLWDAVRRLPARQAQTIALVYGCGYSLAETARILGCGDETVKTHLARGRRTLAERLRLERSDEPAEPDAGGRHDQHEQGEQR
jgi:RNA polymerase sigma-70 factor, ECF subfamily